VNLFEKQAKLNQLFRESPVNAAYLYGKLIGRESFGELTDIDIAILLLEQIKTDQFLDFQLFFLSELMKRLETDKIDVVILNQASLLLKLQVIKYGQIIYSRDDRRRIAFEARAVMEYLDYQRYDELQTKALSKIIGLESLVVDKEFVSQRLLRLREYIELLKGLQKIEKDKFKKDPKIFGLVQWYLQQAVQLTMGTAIYLISALGLRKPEAYHDILTILAGREVIEKNLAYRLEGLANLRNLLVYDATAVDLDEIYEHLQNRLVDFAAFADQIERFVEGNS